MVPEIKPCALKRKQLQSMLIPIYSTYRIIEFVSSTSARVNFKLYSIQSHVRKFVSTNKTINFQKYVFYEYAKYFFCLTKSHS